MFWRDMIFLDLTLFLFSYFMLLQLDVIPKIYDAIVEFLDEIVNFDNIFLFHQLILGRKLLVDVKQVAGVISMQQQQYSIF